MTLALVYASGCALTTLAVLASLALDGPAPLRRCVVAVVAWPVVWTMGLMLLLSEGSE